MLILSTSSTASNVTRAGTIASLPYLDELISLCYDLRWLMLLCVALVITDLKFGIENSIKHHNKIRYSNAARRTINKVTDYLCWLLLGGFLGKALAEPFGIDAIYIACIVIIIASFVEVDSIIQNYFEARGIEGMSLKSVIISAVKIKKSKDSKELEESINDAFDKISKEQ